MNSALRLEIADFLRELEMPLTLEFEAAMSIAGIFIFPVRSIPQPCLSYQMTEQATGR